MRRFGVGRPRLLRKSAVCGTIGCHRDSERTPVSVNLRSEIKMSGMGAETDASQGVLADLAGCFLKTAQKTNYG